MTFFQTIRWFRAYLLAFFVAAQVGGVVPLLYDHTLNLTETTPIPSHAHKQVSNTVTAPDADHHHGALDLHDQCCALHTLAGPLPYVPAVAPARLAGNRVAPAAPRRLVDGDPVLLERPPKPFLSV
jgi:hypothetical protein